MLLNKLNLVFIMKFVKRKLPNYLEVVLNYCLLEYLLDAIVVYT